MRKRFNVTSRMRDHIHSEYDIISDNCKLEVKTKNMKRSAFNLVAGALALAMALALKLYCINSGVVGLFFDLFAVALSLLGMIFFIVEAVKRNRIRSEERQMIDEASRENFGDAEEIPVYDAEAMFVREFDHNDTESTETPSQTDNTKVAETPLYIDKELSFETAALEFEAFAAERGCRFSSDTVKRLFASLAASRLIAVTGMTDQSFGEMMHVLCEYFGCECSIDAAVAPYSDSESLLYKTDDNGNRGKTNLLSALESARNSSDCICLAGITNVVCSDIPLFFSAYVNHIKNPNGRHRVSVCNDHNDEVSYCVPCNLWFVFNLAEDETPNKLPDFIAEATSVNSFPFEKCESAESRADIHAFGYYLMEYLIQTLASESFVDENDWKKIDRLEEYMSSLEDFRIGNRRWRSLERYACAYIACKGEPTDALDEAVAARLIPTAVALTEKTRSTQERSLGEILDAVFGDGSGDACRRMIKLCGNGPV